MGDSMPRFSPLRDLPRPVLTIGREILRHVLKRPVVGLAVHLENERGEVLFIKRADTDTWALPGGTLEWGETFGEAFVRELREETGVRNAKLGNVIHVFSRPDRDPRFHAVTVLVRATLSGSVSESDLRAENPLEIREVKFFTPKDVPRPLAMTMDDFLAAAMSNQFSTNLE